MATTTDDSVAQHMTTARMKATNETIPEVKSNGPHHISLFDHGDRTLFDTLSWSSRFPYQMQGSRWYAKHNSYTNRKHCEVSTQLATGATEAHTSIHVERNKVRDHAFSYHFWVNPTQQCGGTTRLSAEGLDYAVEDAGIQTLAVCV